jgi:hypothetical protein
MINISNEREVVTMKISTVVKTVGGQNVLVDTCFTLDHGYETMVFPCKANGEVTDWGDLDMDLYPNADAARVGHYGMCEKWAGITINDDYDILDWE